MHGWHDTACRRLIVCWLNFRRYGLCFSSVACFGVVELKRGISCAQASSVNTGCPGQLSRCRAGCTRARTMQPVRHSLRVVADYFLVRPATFSRRDWRARFLVVSDMCVCGWRGVCTSFL